ncbi:MAG: response regulator [Planctomycetota bacterium]
MPKKKILVVDDDLQTVKLVGLVLDRRGYEIVAARTGEEAVKKAQSEQPDLIVLDVMMPDMDGYEVSRLLRADPATADVPILMFTAKAGLQDKVTGFEAGADEYLTKPIHPKELVSRVETLLKRYARSGARDDEEITCPVVGFLGSKGGAGTTTLAVNAAVVLAKGDVTGEQAQDAGRVILAEMRCGMATAAIQLGLAPHDGLGSLLEHAPGEISRDLVEAQLDEHGSGLLVLSSRPAPLCTGKQLTPNHAESILRGLAVAAGHLFLDLGVGLDAVNQRLVTHCTRLVVTIEPDSTALTLADELLAELNQSLHIPKHRISLVLV